MTLDARPDGGQLALAPLGARRVVTASDVTALLADTQMHPVPASLG